MSGELDFGRLLEALESLEAEGWFTPWSEDPRVVIIRQFLGKGEAPTEPEGWPTPAPLPADYWESAE